MAAALVLQMARVGAAVLDAGNALRAGVLDVRRYSTASWMRALRRDASAGGASAASSGGRLGRGAAPLRLQRLAP
jgi:hypothetical protein